MPWDAGSIKGKLELDNSGFLHSMLEAHGIAELFPEVVQEFLANPLLGFIGITKEAGKALFEMFHSVQDDAMDLSLAAEKAGTSIEFFSEWAGVAATTKVSVEQLGSAFKFLQKNADELTSGASPDAKELIAAYKELGITTDFLKEHANDAEGLFLAIKNGLQGLSKNDQVYALQEILGRGGSELIPILRMSKEETDKLIQAQKDLGDVTDDNEGKAARVYYTLRTQASEAIDGIKKAIMVPIMEGMAGHADEVLHVIEAIASFIRKIIEDIQAFFATDAGKKILGDLLDDLQSLLKDVPELLALAGDGIQALVHHTRVLADEATTVGRGFENAKAAIQGFWNNDAAPAMKGAENFFGGGGGGGGSTPPASQAPASPGGANPPTATWHDYLPHVPFINPLPPGSHWYDYLPANPIPPIPNFGPLHPSPPDTGDGTMPDGSMKLGPDTERKALTNIQNVPPPGPQSSAAVHNNFNVAALHLHVGDAQGMSPEQLGRMIQQKLAAVAMDARTADMWKAKLDDVADGLGGNT